MIKNLKTDGVIGGLCVGGYGGGKSNSLSGPNRGRGCARGVYCKYGRRI